MFQGQIGDFPFLAQGNWAFSPLSPIFPPVLPKNWALPPSSEPLFRIGIVGYPLKKFGVDKLKITVSISNCIKAVFNYVFAKSQEKHLVIEWLPW